MARALRAWAINQRGKSSVRNFYVKCHFIVGVIALRHLPTLLNVDVDVTYIIIWLCLTRTGNYQIREFDWLKWILTAV